MLNFTTRFYDKSHGRKDKIYIKSHVTFEKQEHEAEIMAVEIRQGEAWEDVPDGRIFYDAHGSQLKFGQVLPRSILVAVRGVQINLESLVEAFGPGPSLIKLVNCVYTRVCRDETCELDKENFPIGTKVVTISVDSPELLRKFRQEHVISRSHYLLSASEAFGEQFGALLGISGSEKPAIEVGNPRHQHQRFLQRTVLVVDGDKVIRHVQYFQDQGQPPNYKPAFDALWQAAGKR